MSGDAWFIRIFPCPIKLYTKLSTKMLMLLHRKLKTLCSTLMNKLIARKCFNIGGNYANVIRKMCVIIWKLRYHTFIGWRNGGCHANRLAHNTFFYCFTLRTVNQYSVLYSSIIFGDRCRCRHMIRLFCAITVTVHFFGLLAGIENAWQILRADKVRDDAVRQWKVRANHMDSSILTLMAHHIAIFYAHGVAVAICCVSVIYFRMSWHYRRWSGVKNAWDGGGQDWCPHPWGTIY